MRTNFPFDTKLLFKVKQLEAYSFSTPFPLRLFKQLACALWLLALGYRLMPAVPQGQEPDRERHARATVRAG